MLGPLWDLARALWDLGARCTSIAVYLAPIFVLGQHLTPRFLQLASLFFRAAAFTWDANRALIQTQIWINRIRWEGGINDLIRAVFGWWDQLRRTPWIFVSEMIVRVWPSWRRFYQDPGGFVLGKITDRYPELRKLLNDPWDWIRQAIEIRLGLGAGFFADPLRHIKRWIYQTYPQLKGLFDYPHKWIRRQLIERFGLDPDLLDDPTAWAWKMITRSIERYLQSRLDWLIRIVAETVKNVWVMRV